MNRIANRPLAVLALALMGASFATRAADAEVGAATARLIGRVAETGDRVYWSCGSNHCAIQIAIEDRALRSSQRTDFGFAITLGPPTQVWLLKADGSLIPPKAQTPTAVGAKNFQFPASARDEAFAVVVRIDRKLHTWWMAERETDPGKQGSANASR